MFYIENEANVTSLKVRYSTGKRAILRTKMFTELKTYRGWEKSVINKQYIIDSIEPTYAVEMKKVVNLMTKKEVEIPVDTPWCCNPASETYWCN